MARVWTWHTPATGETSPFQPPKTRRASCFHRVTSLEVDFDPFCPTRSRKDRIGTFLDSKPLKTLLPTLFDRCSQRFLSKSNASPPSASHPQDGRLPPRPRDRRAGTFCGISTSKLNCTVRAPKGPQSTCRTYPSKTRECCAGLTVI